MIKKSDLTKKFYKPKEVKLLLGLSLSTIQNITKDGRLVDVRTDTNRRLIIQDSLLNYLDNMGLLIQNETRFDIVYARVSTHKQKHCGDLDRQIQTLINFVVDKNPKSLQIISDVGSGLNDKKNGLNKLISLIQNKQIEFLLPTKIVLLVLVLII